MGATIVYYTVLIEISQVVIYRSDGHMPMNVTTYNDSNSEQESADD